MVSSPKKRLLCNLSHSVYIIYRICIEVDFLMPQDQKDHPIYVSYDDNCYIKQQIVYLYPTHIFPHLNFYIETGGVPQ